MLIETDTERELAGVCAISKISIVAARIVFAGNSELRAAGTAELIT